jgi:hypothetical protein
MMAFQTLGVLFFDGGSPLSRETDERVVIGSIRNVPGTRTMAGFAHAPLAFVPRILPESPGVNRVAKVLVLRGMASGANFFAHVGCRAVDLFFRRCSLRHGSHGEQQVCRQHDAEQRIHKRPKSTAENGMTCCSGLNACGHAPPKLSKLFVARATDVTDVVLRQMDHKVKKMLAERG